MNYSLTALLESIGLEPEDKGEYFIVRCPSCGKREMFLYKKSKTLVCNRRNRCGSIIRLSDFLRENGFDKKYIISNFFNDENSIMEKREDVKESKLVIPDGLNFFSGDKKSIIKDSAYNYLKSRGIQDKYIKKLGYIFNPNIYYNMTIFIPFFENGEIVYYTCRDFTGTRYKIKEDGEKELIRYIAAKGINSHDYVFNYDEIKSGEDLFIFEGLFCAMSLKDQIGTATLTDTIGDVQASKIWDKAPGRIILVPDNDLAGKKSLMRNYKKLLYHRPPSMSDVEILMYKIEDTKDFNETKKEFIKEEDFEQIKKTSFDAFLSSFL